ncbi:VanW family protein [[Clostridium] aminophilum]|uniref:VanW family protein n=1 Tax=[Clostridium] aminophilum TaxID=1526 RepID=UPI003328942E
MSNYSERRDSSERNYRHAGSEGRAGSGARRNANGETRGARSSGRSSSRNGAGMSYSARNYERRTSGEHYRGGRGGSGRRSGGRKGRRNDRGIFILAGVLAALIIVAIAIAAVKGHGGGETSETSAEETISKEKMAVDVLVDYSAIKGSGDKAVLNLKGLDRETAGKKLKETYSWSMKVLNTNPDLDNFKMPTISQKEEAEKETGADSEGTVYEVEVDDPLANVTIMPEKEQFEVPDVIGEEIDLLLDKIYEEKLGIRINRTTDAALATAELQSGAETAAQEADYTLELPEFNKLAKEYASQLAVIWEDKPKNGDIASLDKETGKWVFGGFEDGYRFNSDKIAEKLAKAMKDGDYSAEIKADGEVVSGSAASSKDKYKTMATFTTHTTANEVRNKNVKLAAKAIDGTVLRPGEEFSFNTTVGERTEAKGFGAAGAYNNGEVVQEIGGGVCQVSSTLFNAVFRAGLTTTYRRSHTFEPSYVTPGMDATVSWGGPDYRFVNNSDHAIGIRASYSDRTCTVSIYGVPVLEDGEKWSLESKKVKDLPMAEPQEITTGTPTKGTAGSVWEVYKVVTKDGKETSRKLDHTTNYKGHTPTFLKGTGESSSESESAENESGSAGETAEPTAPGSETTAASAAHSTESEHKTTAAAATEAAAKHPADETTAHAVVQHAGAPTAAN